MFKKGVHKGYTTVHDSLFLIHTRVSCTPLMVFMDNTTITIESCSIVYPWVHDMETREGPCFHETSTVHAGGENCVARAKKKRAKKGENFERWDDEL